MSLNIEIKDKQLKGDTTYIRLYYMSNIPSLSVLPWHASLKRSNRIVSANPL